MYEKFNVVGVSYHHSPLEVREFLSLTEADGRTLMQNVREILGVEEAMVISTCNRTEIYYSGDSELTSQIASLLMHSKGLSTHDKIRDYFKSLHGKDAVNHLYEVALGLDAKVLGDIQISNQIKRAYQASADEQMAGPFLHRLMHAIFYANKRVVQETAFRDGAASTSYASVDLTEGFIVNFRAPKILVLGLGEIGEDVAGNLVDVQAEITLANRTYAKSQELAEKYGFHSLTLESALENILKYDVVISSASVGSPIINAGMFAQAGMTMKLLIDLSVPRSIDHEIENIHGVILYNIDQIEEKTTEIQQRRKEAITDVRQIMLESIAELENWAQEMEVSPTIKKLKQALEDIRTEELSRYLKHADEEQAKLLDKVTKSMLQKVLKLPVLQLKAACKRGEAETLVEVLNDLFNLENQPLLDEKSDKQSQA